MGLMLDGEFQPSMMYDGRQAQPKNVRYFLEVIQTVQDPVHSDLTAMSEILPGVSEIFTIPLFWRMRS